MKTLDKVAEVYEEIVRVATYCNEKRKEGWILLDENGDVVADTFYFEGWDKGSKGLCLSTKGSRVRSMLLQCDRACTHGKSTLLAEHKEALKHLRRYKLFEPQKVHSL